MSKNKLTKGAVATALVGLVAIQGPQINAEEVTQPVNPAEPKIEETTATPSTVTPTSQEVAKPTEVAQPTTETTTTEIAKETVDEARAKSDEANAKVSAQKEVVAEKETAKADADKAVSEQEKEVETRKAIKDKATPEKIAEAKADLKAKEDAVSTKDTEIANAKSNLTEKEAKVEETQAKADKQAQAVADATKVRDEKQENVNKAQAILDNTDEGKALKALEDAKANKEAKASNVTAKETTLEDAKKHDAKLASDKAENKTALDQATAQKVSADAEAKSAMTDNKAKQDALDKAEKEQRSAVSALKEATKDDVIFDKNNKLIQEYVTLLKTPLSGKTQVEKQNILKRLGELSRDLSKQMSYKQDKTLNRIVDITNLSEADKLRFSKYAEDLHNQIRSAFGTSKVIYNNEMQRFADEVADGYEAHKHSVFGVSAEAQRLAKQGVTDLPIGHDAKAINDVARKYGLATSSPEREAKGGQYYENMYTTSLGKTKLTVNEVYQRIFDTFNGFMFNGMEYAHASSIADAYSTRTDDIEYAGISFSQTKNTTAKSNPNFPDLKLDYEVHTHVLGVDTTALSRRKANREREFDTSVTPSTIDTLKANLTKAEANLAKATTDANASAKRLTDATKRIMEIANRISQLNDRKAELDKEPTLVAGAQSELDKAKAELKQAVKDVQDAQTAVDKFNASLAEKTKALNDAKAELQTAQTNLDSALAQKVIIDSALEDAKQAVETQKTVIADLEQARSQAVIDVQKQVERVDSLEKADQRYNEAVAKLDELKQTAKSAEEALSQAVLVLTKLQEEANKLQTEADEIQTKYDAQEAKKAEEARRIEEARIAEENRLAEEARLAEYDRIIADVDSQFVAGAKVQERLPETGVDGSAVSSIAGLFFATLGAGILPRRKRNK